MGAGDLLAEKGPKALQIASGAIPGRSAEAESAPHCALKIVRQHLRSFAQVGPLGLLRTYEATRNGWSGP